MIRIPSDHVFNSTNQFKSDKPLRRQRKVGAGSPCPHGRKDTQLRTQSSRQIPAQPRSRNAQVPGGLQSGAGRWIKAPFAVPLHPIAGRFPNIHAITERIDHLLDVLRIDLIRIAPVNSNLANRCRARRSIDATVASLASQAVDLAALPFADFMRASIAQTLPQADRVVLVALAKAMASCAVHVAAAKPVASTVPTCAG